MNDKTKSKKGDSLDKFFDAVVKLTCISFDVFVEGWKTKKWKRTENLWLFITLAILLFNVVLKSYHIDFLKFFSFPLFYPLIDSLVSKIHVFWHLLATLLGLMLSFLFFFGLKNFKIKRKYQKGIDRLRFKSGLDEKPKVIKIRHLNENRTKLLLKSAGLGQDRYKGRLDDLRASVGQRVESVKYNDKDSTMVEVFLARKPLEKIINYADTAIKLKRPYSFVVGKSLSGFIQQSIEELPHLMIGGTSGGGKSHTLNNVLVNLLESSKDHHLQMYLIDLKGGLEIKDYENLPHVELIKTVEDATETLEKLVDEMERRYKHLEKNGHKKIDPKRDKMNRIIVAIDECTDLLGQVPRGHSDYNYIKKAIEHCDKLARKARASGIHLILATQKIDKTSIPTRIQENMQGRIAMRVKTMENSVRMLGNRRAYDLPAIPGRAIWSKDSDFHEVQIPFITDYEVKQRVQKVLEDMNSGTKMHFDTEIKEQVEIVKEENGRGWQPTSGEQEELKDE